VSRVGIEKRLLWFAKKGRLIEFFGTTNKTHDSVLNGIKMFGKAFKSQIEIKRIAIKTREKKK
jgi:hypothetical protein